MVNQTFTESIGMIQQTGILDIVLPFLLTFAIVYGMLLKMKLFGEKQSVNAVIALVAALLVALSPGSRGFLSALFPLYTVYFILIIMMFFLFIFFGVKTESIVKSRPIMILVVAFLIILFLVSLGGIGGEELQEIGLSAEGLSANGTVGDWTTRPWGEQIILGFRDPKVFGMIIMLVIFALGTWAIIKASNEPGKK